MSKILCDVAEIIDSLHKTPKYKENGFPMVRVVDVNNGFLDLENCFTVDKNTCDKHNKNHVPQMGDVIFTRVGSYGMLAYVNTNKKFCLGQNIAIISPKVNGKFLYYYLRSPFIQNIICGNSGGSSYKCISLEEIKRLPYRDDNLNAERIGELLYSIDSKIENNIKINKVLEIMAKTIYDYWFLQFEFPNEDGKPYKSSGGKMVWNEELKKDIPESWKNGTLEDVGEIVAGGTPSTEHPEYYCKNGIAWITPNDLSNSNDKYISHGERDISDIGLINSSAKLMPKGTVLLTSRAPIGYIGIAINEVCTNQGFKSIVPNKKFGSEFIYYTIQKMIEYLKLLGTGSTFTEISKNVVAQVKIVLPEESVVNKFEKITSEISGQRRILEEENRELISLREFLLPLLMNGQVGFKD